MNSLQQSIHNKLKKILGFEPFKDSLLYVIEGIPLWNLAQLLMAIDKPKTFLVSDMGEMWTMEITDYEPKMQYIGDFDLTKSVLEQDESVLQKIGEIL